MSRISTSTLVGLVLAAALTGAQAPPPAPPAGGSAAPPEVTFKTEVNYVEEDVRVVDRSGRFVTGLTRDDFELFEDKKPQKITTFGMVDVPLTPPARPLFAGRDALPIDPDTASNEEVLDGRLYLLLLDDYHVAPLRSQTVKNLARKFVLEKLGANDQAAVVTTSGFTKAYQDFTQNRRLLVDAIDHFVGQKLPSATLGKLDMLSREVGQPSSDNPASTDTTQTRENFNTEDESAPERMFNARAALNSVRAIAEWMGAIQGRRKAIVYISEGVDFNLYDMFTGSDPSSFNFADFNTIQQETIDTVSAATRSNVQIYPVDPRGLTAMAQEDIEISGQALPGYHLGAESLAHELLTSQMNLRQLAEETGGVAAVGSNDLDKAFDRIVEENSSYYVLGYYPTNEKRDGRFRTIAVKVKGYPDAQVTFRKRYAAPRGKPKTSSARTPSSAAAGLTAELMETLATPLPKAGLPLRISAVAHRGVTPKMMDLEVLIATSGRDLSFAEHGGTFNDTLSLSIGVFNKEGKSVAAERPDIALALKPETHARLVQNGIRVMRHLSLPPGRYQLRVAAQDSAKTRQGSAHFDVEVPDFTREPLALGGVAIASTADRSLTTPLQKDPFGGGLPAQPTTMREFPAGSEIAAFVEVYDNKPSPVHRIDITTRVKADDGRVVFTHADERSTEELHGSPGGFGYSVRVPMTGWAPGLYVLAIEAKSRAGNQEPVSRPIQFAVK